MDIKEEVIKVAEKISKDKELLQQFKKDPIKAVQKLVGVDIPAEIVEKIVDGVKAKISVDNISEAIGSLKKIF